MLTTRRIFLLLTLILASLVQPRMIPTVKKTQMRQDERVLLLTAHPDDETFFFSPTLTALSRRPTSPRQQVGGIGDIFVVCLSTGNAKGLGSVRKEEFRRALGTFGIKEERGFILDHPGLQDNKSSTWEPAIIASEIHPLVVEYGITTVLTFDTHGITEHPNHKSAFAGAAHLILNSWPLPSPIDRPRLFTLSSHSISTKNIGPLAALTYKLSTSDKNPIFVASLVDYFTALRAMSKHPSQLRLFPFLKGLLSRYLWVNEWVEVKV